jgi:hypothetical protein
VIHSAAVFDQHWQEIFASLVSLRTLRLLGSVTDIHTLYPHVRYAPLLRELHVDLPQHCVQLDKQKWLWREVVAKLHAALMAQPLLHLHASFLHTHGYCRVDEQKTGECVRECWMLPRTTVTVIPA